MEELGSRGSTVKEGGGQGERDRRRSRASEWKASGIMADRRAVECQIANSRISLSICLALQNKFSLLSLSLSIPLSLSLFSTHMTYDI